MDASTWARTRRAIRSSGLSGRLGPYGGATSFFGQLSDRLNAWGLETGYLQSVLRLARDARAVALTTQCLNGPNLGSAREGASGSKNARVYVLSGLSSDPGAKVIVGSLTVSALVSSFPSWASFSPHATFKIIDGTNPSGMTWIASVKDCSHHDL
jgi:hypothetical protein